MAQVPDDQIGDVQQEPIAGRAIPRIDDSVSGAAFGETLGDGLQVAGRNLQQVQQRADQSAIIKANTQLINQKNDLLTDPKNGAYTKMGENAIDLAGTYEPQFDQSVQQISSSLANPKQQAAFQQFAAQQKNEFSLGLNRHEFEQQHVAQNAIAENAMEALARDAKNTRDPEVVAQRKNQIAMLANDYASRNGLAGTQDNPTGFGTNLALKYNQDIDGEQGRIAVDADPAGALKRLTTNDPEHPDPIFNDVKGSLRDELIQRATTQSAKNLSDGIVNYFRNVSMDAGEKQVQAMEKNPNIPDSVKDLARQQIHAGVAQYQGEQREKYDKLIESVNEHIAGGPVSDADINAVYGMWHKGVYTGAEAGRLIGGIRAQMLAQIPDTTQRDWAIDQRNKGLTMNPTDDGAKKGVDAAFTMETKNLTPYTDEWNNQAANWLRLGVLPKSAMDQARADFVAGDPATAAKAAMALRRWERQSPSGMDYAMDEKTKAIYGVTADMLEGGANPVSAITNARNLQLQSKDTTQRLGEEWDKLPKASGGNHANLTALQDELTKDVRFQSGMLSKNYTIPPDVQGAYERMTHDNYLMNGGNLPSAQASAVATIKNKWGVSSVNGTPQIMPWAPEALNPGLTTASIRDDISNVVADLNRMPVTTGGIVKPGTIKPYDQRAFGSNPMTFPNNDKTETVIPTVIDGKQLSREEAMQAYLKSGENLGTFKSRGMAQLFLQSMSEGQRRVTEKEGIDPEKVQLVLAPMTENSKGQNWYLGMPDEHGLPQIMNGKDGRPLIYTLPNGVDVAKADRQKAADEGMRIARKHQENDAFALERDQLGTFDPTSPGQGIP